MPIDPADIRPLLAVRALGPADVLAGGEGILMEWDGAQWTKLFSPAGVKYLAMASGGDSVWVGTDAGYLWLRDATGWVKKSAPVYYDYGALWVDGEGRVSATGPHPSPVSILWQGTGDPWSSLEVSTPEGIPEPWAAGSNPQVNGLWARGPEDLFVVTQQQQILRYAYHQ
ncbi:MAG: hypothetical protein FJ098_12900 [Deltaproteobacteria bacterium]|nr:hypothetical protein [Deltaproteobacteria bacterium]